MPDFGGLKYGGGGSARPSAPTTRKLNFAAPSIGALAPPTGGGGGGGGSFSIAPPGQSGTKRKPRSLLSQALDLPGELVSGFANTTWDTIQTAAIPFSLGARLATGDESFLTDLKNSVPMFTKTAPAMAKSIYHTGGRILNPIDAYHEYRKASKEGHLLSQILEDAGNIALVAGGVESAFGRVPAVSAPVTLSEGAGMAGEAGAMQSGALARGAAGARALGEAEPMVSQALGGKGLAGLAAKADMMPLARGLDTAGRVAGGIAKGGNALAGPFGTAGDIAEGIGKKFGKDWGQYRPSNFIKPGAQRLVQGAYDNGATGLWRWTEEGRKYQERSQVHADLLPDAERHALDPGVIGKKYKLTDSEGRAALLSLDRRAEQIRADIVAHPELLQPVNGGPSHMEQLIERTYADDTVPISQRPTLEDFQKWIEFEDGTLARTDPQKFEGMQQVAERQRQISQADQERITDPNAWDTSPVDLGTTYKVGENSFDSMQRAQEFADRAGGIVEPVSGETSQYTMKPDYEPQRDWATGGAKKPLNPAQTGDTLMPHIVAKFQREAGADLASKTKQWETAENTTLHEERIGRSIDAIYNQLPAAPDPRVERAAGEAIGKQKGLRRAHQHAQVEVNRALHEYAAVAEDLNPERVKVATDALDVANEREDRIRQQIETVSRREQAATALSRASGEFEPGARRVLDPETGQVTQVTEGSTRPEVSVQGAPSAKEIRDRIEARKAEVAYQAQGEVDRISNGTKYRFSGKTGAGEYDFGAQVSAGDRARLTKDQFFGNFNDVVDERGVVRKVPNKFGVDQLASDLEAAGYPKMNPDEAAAFYVDKIRELWDAQSKGGENFVRDIAGEMGLPEHIVQASLTPKLSDFSGMLASEPAQIITDLRTDFDSLDQQGADYARTMLTEALDTEGMTPSDYAQVLNMVLPGTSVDALETMLVDNKVDMHQLTDWVLNDGKITSLRAMLEKRGAPQNMQLGRLAGEKAGLQAQLRELGDISDDALRSVGVALKQGQDAERMTAKRLNQATEYAEKTAVPEGPLTVARDKEGRTVSMVQDPSEAAQAHRRHDTKLDGPLSTAERMRQQQGAQRERIRAARVHSDQIRRSLEKAQRDVGNMPKELSRRFQTRIVEDVNGPALSSMRSAAHQGVSRLGEVKGKGDTMYLTGEVSKLAGKYGVYDQVLEHAAQTKMSKAIDAGWEPGFEDDPMPNVPLSPQDVRQAFDYAMQDAGRNLEGWELQSLDDSLRSGHAQYMFDQLMDEVGMRKVDREPYPTSIGGTTGINDTPGAYGQKWSGEGGAALTSPQAARNLFDELLAGSPEPVRTAMEKAWEGYQKKNERMLVTSMDKHAEAMPATYRAVHLNGKRYVAELLDYAEEMRKGGNAGDGDVFANMAWDATTSMEDMQGLDLTHLMGGDEVRGGTVQNKTTGARNRKLRSSNQMGTGLRELSLDPYARVERGEAVKWMKNQRDNAIAKEFGKPISEIPRGANEISAARLAGKPIDPYFLTEQLKGEGWVPLDPAKGINENTIMLPEKVRQALDSERYWNNDSGIAAKTYRGFRKVNSMFKTMVLGTSTKWLTGNVMGNLLMAWLHGGVSPLKVARSVKNIAKAMSPEGTSRRAQLAELWRNEGLLPELPARLSGTSHTAHEFEIKYGKEMNDGEPSKYRVGRVKDRIKNYTYAANSFVDNLTRSSVYLEKLKSGLPREASLKATLRAMGDFTRMTPFEQRFMREAFPFYAWMRHSTAATLRLPFDSPMRAAMLYQIGNVTSDPDVRAEIARLAGSRLPLGGGTFLDMGSSSPLTDISQTGITAFDPRSLGGALTPGFKVPFQLLTGVDPSTWTQSARPSNTFSHSELGAKKPTPTFAKLLEGDFGAFAKETAWQLSRQTPLSRGLSDVVYGNEVRYGGTPYPVKNLTDPNRTWNRSLLRAFNLPGLYTVNTDDAQKRAAKARG